MLGTTILPGDDSHGMALRPDAMLWQEAVHEYGEMRCEVCGPVNLENAETVNEGIEIWNEHVREKHGDE